jgi:hypothetical protein
VDITEKDCLKLLKNTVEYLMQIEKKRPKVEIKLLHIHKELEALEMLMRRYKQ